MRKPERAHEPNDFRPGPADGASVVDAGSPSAQAIAASRASRARLAPRMLPPSLPPAEADADGPAPWPCRALRQAWQGGLGALDASPLGPVLATARDLLQHWWQRHPWRATAEAVENGFNDLAWPLVRRHPIASVALGAGLAAAVVW